MKGKESGKYLSHHEKRIFPRKMLRTQVIFEDETGEGFIYFYSTDVSLGGIFLESDVPLKLGTKIFLSFALRPGERPIRTTAEVVRFQKEDGDSPTVIGMGVRFLDLEAGARAALEQFLKSDLG